MDFQPSDRCAEFKERLSAFMDEHVYPAEEVYARELRESGDPHSQPPVMEELKTRARDAGLWNMFLPDEHDGAGLSNSDYAPLAGRCWEGCSRSSRSARRRLPDAAAPLAAAARKRRRFVRARGPLPARPPPPRRRRGSDRGRMDDRTSSSS